MMIIITYVDWLETINSLLARFVSLGIFENFREKTPHIAWNIVFLISLCRNSSLQIFLANRRYISIFSACDIGDLLSILM